MRQLILIVLCSLFALTGCGGKLQVNRFEGHVPLKYGETSGIITILAELGDFSFKLPTAETTLEYAIKKDGDSLLWDIVANGKYIGIKHGKHIRKDLSAKVSLYPLEPSHAPIRFVMRTDWLGNIDSMEKFVGEAGLQDVGDDYWKVYYQKLFSMVFVPFVTDKAQIDTVVSNGQCGIQADVAINFPPPQIVLTGTRKEHGRECLALQYENTSNQYKDKYRQKNVDTVKVEIMVDKDTRIVQRSFSVVRTKNVMRFLTIKSVKKD